MAIEPGKRLQNTLSVVHRAFHSAGVPYWLSFGGLWGLVRNNGIIPDNDLDFCTYYGADHERLAKILGGFGYTMTRCMLSDVEPRAVYASFDHPQWIHFCLSFWYPYQPPNGPALRFYCHDSAHEIQGVGIPTVGYHFRGTMAEWVDGSDMFLDAEWPGIQQMIKVRVPRFPGGILDTCYPAWAYKKQRYNLAAHEVIPEKMRSYYHGGAMSKWAVSVKSMRQWEDHRHVAEQLAVAEERWRRRLREVK